MKYPYCRGIHFLGGDNLLITKDNLCLFYDLKNIEGEMGKCIKLSASYNIFESKIFKVTE
jgi:hypothetical protein